MSLPLAALTSAAFPSAARHRGAPRRVVPLTLAASSVLKRLNPEQRPCLWHRHPRQSFPSSHSSATTAYALSIVDSFAARWALPIAAALIGTVNVARVRDHEHWRTDVLCGDIVGARTGMAAASPRPRP
jgi:membrane-associated phospholipid phosphatase